MNPLKFSTDIFLGRKGQKETLFFSLFKRPLDLCISQDSFCYERWKPTSKWAKPKKKCSSQLTEKYRELASGKDCPRGLTYIIRTHFPSVSWLYCFLCWLYSQSPCGEKMAAKNSRSSSSQVQIQRKRFFPQLPPGPEINSD